MESCEVEFGKVEFFELESLWLEFLGVEFCETECFLCSFVSKILLGFCACKNASKSAIACL